MYVVVEVHGEWWKYRIKIYCFLVLIDSKLFCVCAYITVWWGLRLSLLRQCNTLHSVTFLLLTTYNNRYMYDFNNMYVYNTPVLYLRVCTLLFLFCFSSKFFPLFSKYKKSKQQPAVAIPCVFFESLLEKVVKPASHILYYPFSSCFPCFLLGFRCVVLLLLPYFYFLISQGESNPCPVCGVCECIMYIVQ